MTAQAPPRRADAGRGGLGFAARRYRRLRDAHPVDVLRWLRTCVLLCVLASAAVCLGVTLQASNDISAVRSTQQAGREIAEAGQAEAMANTELSDVFADQDPTLTGLGPAYYNDITAILVDLSGAARDNGPGTIGTGEIPYAENLLSSYLQLSQAAVTDYALDPTTGHTRLGRAGEAYAAAGEQLLRSALSDKPCSTGVIRLGCAEQSAFQAQRGTWSLNGGPDGFWWALASPLVVLLLLTVATARVLARHFRRLVSGWLLGALAVTAATAAALGYLNARDAASLAADPWASHPATLTIAVLLFAGAAALVYRAYQPRLDEYLFRPAGEPGEGPL